MIKQNVVEAALEREHDPEAPGQVCDQQVTKGLMSVSRSRKYRVYLPSNYRSEIRYPMLMVLHGCRQDHLAIQTITGFDAIAERVGAIVVYPFVTSYSGMRTKNCWGWWLERQRQRGRGEVADLWQIAEQVSKDFSVDERRRHICGLSSGGAMAVAALATYSDYWASGASVAGLPYGESMRAVRTSDHLPVRRKTVNTVTRLLTRALVTKAPALLVIQASEDSVVDPALAANLRDSWRSVLKCDRPAHSVYSGSTRSVAWRLEQYGEASEPDVAHLFMADLDHGWAGGLPGKYSFPEAPNTSELIWAFCEHTVQRSAQTNDG